MKKAIQPAMLSPTISSQSCKLFDRVQGQIVERKNCQAHAQIRPTKIGHTSQVIPVRLIKT